MNAIQLKQDIQLSKDTKGVLRQKTLLEIIKDDNLKYVETLLEKGIKVKDIEILVDFIIKEGDVPKCLNCGKSIEETPRKLCCSMKCLNSSTYFKEKAKASMLERYGVTNCSQAKEIKEKKKETTMKNYGVPIPAMSNEVQNKMKQTLLDKTGYEYASQNPETRKKIKTIILEKYGVGNVAQNKGIRNKAKTTSIERYGEDLPIKNKVIRNKAKETMVKKYGVDNPSKQENVKRQKIETCLKNYGVEHYTKSQEMFEKALLNSRKRKPFQLGNREIKIQGYEPQCLDILLTKENILPEDIAITKSEGKPIIRYIHKNKERIYHPDFYIKSQNRIIEVKSTWTYKLHLELNLAKQQACIEQGYNFEVYIISKYGKGRIDHIVKFQ